ncbi:hypothetical protein L2E82_01828 [Cichorium intybus]|uniref:Uncharacterized protein n=1 Tax=Cichorium intybus TaxID=13427 RepID=A0ACB9H182_CICIN|nr:hypothetical protein L2E82_01828 [Cichorium intybus]
MLRCGLSALLHADKDHINTTPIESTTPIEGCPADQLFKPEKKTLYLVLGFYQKTHTVPLRRCPLRRCSLRRCTFRDCLLRGFLRLVHKLVMERIDE